MTSPSGNQKILIISHDVIGSRMAGPGIRYYHIARVLSKSFDVLLAVPQATAPDLPPTSFRTVTYQRNLWDSLAPLTSQAGAIILNGYSLVDFPQLSSLEIPLVIDGYDPHLAEWLQMTQFMPKEQEAGWEAVIEKLSLQYRAGDFFICASERQRDWWLGLLEANGRINPWTVQEDASMRHLVDVVAYGVLEAPPVKSRTVIRNLWPEIRPADKIILWGGGLWLWLDPLTAIRAISQIWGHRQDVRLVFPGTRHPNPGMSQMPTHLEAARALSKELGLLDKVVFFGDWLPYQDWPDVLLESDVALSLSACDSLETRLAFRSRVFDYIWAGLPWISTPLDATSDLLTQYELGALVNLQDVSGLANAMEAILSRPRSEYQAAFQKARTAFTWENVTRPLVNFCNQPHLAPDKPFLKKKFLVSLPQTPDPRQPEIDGLQQQVASLENLVVAYRRRRIVRFADWIANLKIFNCFPRSKS